MNDHLTQLHVVLTARLQTGPRDELAGGATTGTSDPARTAPDGPP
ncbi:hypothetical protein [Actinoplanes lobatus]|uniref:Uncharacterized protein n=1 Tax=Actinoplanes lobatus TaxID=113568 RepID=A0A7W7MI25_9ACTN|nr:hypothetical protein [Actinoplanes lobatus]MBB4751069.1 hypothetical protein [Actinoplanes lobatus]